MTKQHPTRPSVNARIHLIGGQSHPFSAIYTNLNEPEFVEPLLGHASAAARTFVFSRTRAADEADHFGDVRRWSCSGRCRPATRAIFPRRTLMITGTGMGQVRITDRDIATHSRPMAWLSPISRTPRARVSPNGIRAPLSVPPRNARVSETFDSPFPGIRLCWAPIQAHVSEESL